MTCTTAALMLMFSSCLCSCVFCSFLVGGRASSLTIELLIGAPISESFTFPFGLPDPNPLTSLFDVFSALCQKRLEIIK